MAMVEVNEAAQTITESIDPEAKVIFGAVINDKLRKGELKVTVIATGFENQNSSNFSSSSEKDEAAKKENNFDNNNSNNNFNSVPSPEYDQWDIPAFVRKKKKKK